MPFYDLSQEEIIQDKYGFARAFKLSLKPGNRDGQYAFSNAPNTAQLVWDFFKSTYQSGFGAADSSYLELFNQHGVSGQFWLYRAKETNNWYADISNIPSSS